MRRGRDPASDRSGSGYRRVLGGGAYAVILQSRGTLSVNVEKHIDYESVDIAPVAVPMLREGQLKGYAVAKVTASAAADDVKKAKANIVLYVTEALFRSLFDDRDFDPTQKRPAQLEALGDKIAAATNKRLGRSTVKSVIFESINVLEPRNVRSVITK